jgi:hypothetical protein
MQSRTITTDDLAHLLATTRKTVAVYAKAGVVKRRGRGRYDEVASVRGFAKHMRAVPKGVSATATVASERAGLLSVQRRHAELNLAKAMGDLQSRSEIEAEFSARCKTVRDELLRVYGVLLNSSVDRDVAKLVDDKIRDSLTIFAEGGTLEGLGYALEEEMAT